jgi:hypothetical protein
MSGLVEVSIDDLRLVLDQRVMHSHQRPGIWDPDNRLGVADTRCLECAARERLRKALAEELAP